MITYKISKNVKDSIKHCILAIFWPRNEILDFLRDSGCTNADLAKVKRNLENLKRHQIIEETFAQLDSRPDNGTVAYSTIIEKLGKWTFFNPYYFDELKKLDKSVALQAIKDLNKLRIKLEEETTKKVRKAQEFIAKDREALATQDELKQQLNYLLVLKDKQGKTITKAQRGYDLEKFLKDICKKEGINVTKSFKIEGEQIDASLKYDGENYIVEAKWQDKEIANEALYQFAGKVEGKMYGRGIFISINGYSATAITALKTGKAIKTILFDGEDLIHAVNISSFKDILEAKIKASQIEGKIYINALTLDEKIGYK